jgi:hypothetical protein
MLSRSFTVIFQIIVLILSEFLESPYSEFNWLNVEVSSCIRSNHSSLPYFISQFCDFFLIGSLTSDLYFPCPFLYLHSLSWRADLIHFKLFRGMRSLISSLLQSFIFSHAWSGFSVLDISYLWCHTWFLDCLLINNNFLWESDISNTPAI